MFHREDTTLAETVMRYLIEHSALAATCGHRLKHSYYMLARCFSEYDVRSAGASIEDINLRANHLHLLGDVLQARAGTWFEEEGADVDGIAARLRRDLRSLGRVRSTA